jgi:type IV secretion system protein VirD4
LIFIRGERALKDFKYDILKHPNIELTADGKAPMYEHGKVESAILSIEVIRERKLKINEEVPENNIDNKYDVVFSNQIEGYLLHEREELEKKEKEKEIIKNEEINENE